MKKYKMNECRLVNTKSGIEWKYRGKYNTIEEAIAEAKKWSNNIGVKVTDCETGEVVHKEMW